MFFFFFLLLIPFAVYFVRPDIIGNDGYGFMHYVCTGEDIVGLTFFPRTVLNLLPCSFLAVKVLLFGLAFVSGFFILKLCSLFSKNWGRAAWLIFLSSVFVLEAAKFENDQFAFPLLFASLYFFFKWLKQKDVEAFVDSFGCLFFAGMFWQGSVFYLFSYTFNLVWVGLLSVPVLVWKFNEVVGTVFRGWLVAEDLPFQFHLHFLLNFGLFGVVFAPVLLPQALFLFALGASANKFFILSLPFLVVGMVLLLDKLEGIDLTGRFSRIFHAIDFSQLFAVLAIFCIIGVSQSLWLNPPTRENWTAIDYGLSMDKNASCDWDMGYWLKFKGGETESYGSPYKQVDFNGMAVTKQETNCKVYWIFGENKVVNCRYKSLGKK